MNKITTTTSESTLSISENPETDRPHPTPEMLHAIGEHNAEEVKRHAPYAQGSHAKDGGPEELDTLHTSTQEQPTPQSTPRGVGVEGWVDTGALRQGMSGVLGVVAMGAGLFKTAVEHTREWVEKPSSGAPTRLDVGPISVSVGGKEKPDKNNKT